MANKLQVVIPYLTQSWCLDDMMESFYGTYTKDAEDYRIPILIVDNSEENYCAHPDRPFPPNVEVVHFGRNIGVAASWNLGLERGADQTLLVSQWVRFAPSEIEWRKDKPCGINWVAEGIEKYASEYGLEFSDQGYHIISIGRKTVNTIGMFDPHFKVFGNDDDYQHRRELARIKGLMNCWADYNESGVHSIAFGVHKRMGTYERVEGYYDSSDYYSSKWCSVPYDYPGDYTSPFNNPENDLSYWPEVEV